ncbi:MAG: dinitrogenase iron-molybdenum cofactor biosynthesis protein [Deltaproteobacteria bacterium]|nr:dinitrogenase iron-molybdenum cofactor biosynthesis protein [Deltaproteobacteria bacterium]
MKIAVSSSGEDLNSQIDPRFGRCARFLIVETDDMSFEVFNNENIALVGGAGIQSARFVVDRGVQAVITGNCGPKAVRTLSAADVELHTGQSGTIKEAIERYRKGELQPTNEPNVSDHYGMGETGTLRSPQGPGLGRGMGMGRGMGQGMGRGGNRGMRRPANRGTGYSGKRE